MTHFVAVAQPTAAAPAPSSPRPRDIPCTTSHLPPPTSHVRRPTHPVAGCSIFACLLFRLCHFDFLICLVASCIHLPLHFICQHCITLSGISSAYPPHRHPPTLAFFCARTCHTLLTRAAPARARQNYLLGKIKSFAILCGTEGVGMAMGVSDRQEKEPGIVSRTQRASPLLPANSRNYCGKGKQRCKHCLTFIAFPFCILPCLSNCLQQQQQQHTHSHTHILPMKIALDKLKSFAFADRLIDRRTRF